MPVKDPKAYAALSAEIAACETELGMNVVGGATLFHDISPAILIAALIAKRNDEYSKLKSYKAEHYKLQSTTSYNTGWFRAGGDNENRIAVLDDLINVQVQFVEVIDRLLAGRRFDVSTLPK
jgi:hypothetical protein